MTTGQKFINGQNNRKGNKPSESANPVYASLFFPFQNLVKDGFVFFFNSGVCSSPVDVVVILFTSKQNRMVVVWKAKCSNIQFV